ncbi:MAG: hypothetical protein IJ272_09250 [Clostridia bacterium]|nr:hypothetical protein [Clostridia bacterium]
MLKKWFKEYIEINKRDILIVVGLMLLGVIVGIGAYIFSSDAVKELAVTSVKEVFDISKSEAYVKTNIIVNGMKADILFILVFAILSVTLFGKWIIYIIVMLKGAALSLYTILLFNIFGPLWGIVTFILLVLLVNILYIPALIYLVVTFLEVNFNVFKTRLNNINVSTTYKILLVIFLSFVIMFSSIVVEQIASSIVLNIYNKI